MSDPFPKGTKVKVTEHTWVKHKRRTKVWTGKVFGQSVVGTGFYLVKPKPGMKAETVAERDMELINH